MNTEVTAIVENESTEKSAEKNERSRMESVFVELGQVSKATQGGFWGLPDGGIGKQF